MTVAYIAETPAPRRITPRIPRPSRPRAHTQAVSMPAKYAVPTCATGHSIQGTLPHALAASASQALPGPQPASALPVKCLYERNAEAPSEMKSNRAPSATVQPAGRCAPPSRAPRVATGRDGERPDFDAHSIVSV